MEHRWGERVVVRQTVKLACGSSPAVAGSLENVSVSGAFVRTEGCNPPRGPVEVVLAEPLAGRGHTVRLAAYVVRETATGVGLEWCEFAPRPIRELMMRGRRSGGARARARAQQPSARYSRGPNMATQPRAQPPADESAAIGTNTLPVIGSAATECA